VTVGDGGPCRRGANPAGGSGDEDGMTCRGSPAAPERTRGERHSSCSLKGCEPGELAATGLPGGGCRRAKGEDDGAGVSQLYDLDPAATETASLDRVCRRHRRDEQRPAVVTPEHTAQRVLAGPDPVKDPAPAFDAYALATE
jgi:hypothetical protein